MLFPSARYITKKTTSLMGRRFSTCSYKEKSAIEIWCSDSGAYPVMFVIGFAVVFSAGAGAYFVGTSPDARVTKSSRKSIFRGELKGAN